MLTTQVDRTCTKSTARRSNVTVGELKEQLAGLDNTMVVTIELGNAHGSRTVVPISDRMRLMTPRQLWDQRGQMVDCDCLVLRRSEWPD